MTPAEFKQARQTLGLSAAQLGRILRVHQRTIRRWEDAGGVSARPPHPTACAVMGWMLEGFRPPEWP